MIYINHYRLGSFELTHKDKKIIVSDRIALSNYIDSLRSKPFTVGYIPAGYEHRPDRISNLFYNTVTNDWILMMFNNIRDPFQELNVGDQILIPTI
jgi:hypothetical protein